MGLQGAALPWDWDFSLENEMVGKLKWIGNSV